MDSETFVPKYARWRKQFSISSGVEQVRITAPSGTSIVRPVYEHQPAEFRYDFHGYEEMESSGEPVLEMRYTPKEEGLHRFQALNDGEAVEEGSFTCTASTHPGYVTISQRDPRYFALSNGESFCPIGLNLCAPVSYPLPRMMEHFNTGERTATLGLREYRRWFRLLSENGGNFTRIWLSNPYFAVETEIAAEVDPLRFNRLDGVVDLAREYGIRLKLCFDHFRAFSSDNPVTRAHFLRRLVDPRSGREAQSMVDWLESPTWQELWFQKVKAYLARYGGDPTVMAWELWNEMDCVETRRWDLVRDWTRVMLTRIKEHEPEQLVVQSLGSFDEERKQEVQDDLKMEEMDFQQVHRYLDQGAPWAICNEDPEALSVDAVQRARRPDRPILLAETGAVNDRHTGPFRYFRMDQRGMIFHDTTFPAFFAGAAGTGQDWWWDSYADQKNVWGQFRPFAALLQGVAIDREEFEALDASNESAWCLVLKGKNVLLGWVRNRADSWPKVLRDEIQPDTLGTQVFDVGLGEMKLKALACFPSWPGEDVGCHVKLVDGKLVVDGLHYGLMVRVEYER
jgi:hypothetical protein